MKPDPSAAFTAPLGYISGEKCENRAGFHLLLQRVLVKHLFLPSSQSESSPPTTRDVIRQRGTPGGRVDLKVGAACRHGTDGETRCFVKLEASQFHVLPERGEASAGAFVLPEKRPSCVRRCSQNDAGLFHFLTSACRPTGRHLLANGAGGAELTGV